MKEERSDLIIPSNQLLCLLSVSLILFDTQSRFYLQLDVQQQCSCISLLQHSSSVSSCLKKLPLLCDHTLT